MGRDPPQGSWKGRSPEDVGLRVSRAGGPVRDDGGSRSSCGGTWTAGPGVPGERDRVRQREERAPRVTTSSPARGALSSNRRRLIMPSRKRIRFRCPPLDACPPGPRIASSRAASPPPSTRRWTPRRGPARSGLASCSDPGSRAARGSLRRRRWPARIPRRAPACQSPRVRHREQDHRGVRPGCERGRRAAV